MTAVFEEHPGMFRAQRFGSERPGKTHPARSVGAGPLSTPLNDAQAFARALAERGSLLTLLKKS